VEGGERTRMRRGLGISIVVLVGEDLKGTRLDLGP
jgi:hypothetical protein